MSAYNPWPDLLLRLCLYTAMLAVVGYALAEPFLILFLGTFAYLLWHLFKIARLESWLRKKQYYRPPAGHGLWESVFDNIYVLQRRHRQRRRRLADILRAFRESVEAVPDAAVILRADGGMLWWNSAAEHLLGLSRATDQGLRIHSLFRDPAFTDFFQRPLKGNRSIVLASPIDDRLALDIRVIPYGDRQRLLLARDITRLQRLEDMRRDFVGNVSHELRTPLTVIHGLSESLVEEHSELSPEQLRALELIQQQTRRMTRLVEDLLLLSRLETTDRPEDLKAVAVPKLLEQVADEARALSGERNHDIVLEQAEPCPLRADEGELRSAFSNLVFNAVNYTPAGGQIRLRWYCDAQGAHFSVADTGVGVAQEHIPRLTERFYRVDRGRSARSGGTGLGLAIVKHILQRYEGRLEIQSQLGVGSTFTCHFPVDRSE